MRISHKHKFLILSNPKCGSTSLCAMFDDYSEFTWKTKDWCLENYGASYKYRQHKTALQHRGLFKQRGWEWEDYIKIATVRNPWDRLVSFYHFRPEKNSPHSSISWDLSFHDFIMNPPNWRGTSIGRPPDDRPTETQKGFVTDEKGNLLVDYVIKMETMNEDLPNIVDKHWEFDKIDYELHLNTTSHKPYWEYYTDKTREKVAELFKEDIDMFGYEFKNTCELINATFDHNFKTIK